MRDVDCLAFSRRLLGQGRVKPGPVALLADCEGKRNWKVPGRRITISRSINIYGAETTGKNENALRTFILTDLQKDVLDDQRRRNPPEGDDFVFGEMTANKYRKRWEKYCAVNGLPKTTPYEIRHTFVSMAQSLPEAMVKSLVGHSKNMDTFGVYGHEVNGQKQEIAKRLESIFQSIINQ